jgi:hypothetical protein
MLLLIRKRIVIDALSLGATSLKFMREEMQQMSSRVQPDTDFKNPEKR